MIQILPAELQTSICSFLDQDALKQLRSCCRSTELAATPSLFRHLRLTYTSEDFDRLTCIATHENLRQYVRSISLAPLIYEPDMSLSQWQHHYNKTRFQQMNAAVWLRQPYEEYTRLWKEQQCLLRTASETWTMALSRMVNVRIVQLIVLESENKTLLERLTKRAFCPPDVYIHPKAQVLNVPQCWTEDEHARHAWEPSQDQHRCVIVCSHT